MVAGTAVFYGHDPISSVVAGLIPKANIESRVWIASASDPGGIGCGGFVGGGLFFWIQSINFRKNQRDTHGAIGGIVGGSGGAGGFDGGGVSDMLGRFRVAK